MRVYWYIFDTASFDGHDAQYMFDTKLFWINTGIITGPKDKMVESLKQDFVDTIQSFLIDIDEKKQEVLKNLRRDAIETEARKYWNNYKIE